LLGKKITIGILITGITIGVIAGIFIRDKGYKPHQINPPPRPEHFNFIFKYGPMAKNVLNTFNGTYTWDMVIDPPVTINMTLTEDDLIRIFSKMIEINFFDYPEVFVVPQKDVYGYVEPFDRYRFFVEYRGFKKTVKWNAGAIYKKRNNEATALKELCNLIIEIIESKPEYKTLPKPRSGYY
jgi:hypothetical protein